jgi:hypothetical protein
MGSDAPLDEAQAAEQLGVSKATLANWRWRRVGPAYFKIGRRVEYRQIDIDGWRDAQRKDPTEAVAG